MKKLLSFLLAAVFAAELAVGSVAFAESELSTDSYAYEEAVYASAESAQVMFTLGEAAVRPGEIAEVDVMVESTTEINSIALYDMTYDSDVFTFVGFGDIEAMEEKCLFPGGFDEEKGIITLALKGKEVLTDKICTLQFRVNEDAPEGTWEIGMSSKVKLTAEVLSSEVTVGEITVRHRILGDINGDDSVDIDDALLLFQHSMLPEHYPVEYPGSLDFTKDGSVDIDDALRLFQYSMLPEHYPIDWGNKIVRDCSQTKIIERNVNDVQGVNFVQQITYDNYFDSDGKLEKAVIKTVEFCYEGAELKGHESGEVGFWHVNDYSITVGIGFPSIEETGYGLFVDDSVWVDFSEGYNNEEAIVYNTCDCVEGECQILYSIKFDLEELNKTITVKSDTSFDLTFMMIERQVDVNAAIDATLIAMAGTGDLEVYSGNIVYTGVTTTSVDGSVAGEVIGCENATEDKINKLADGDITTAASLAKNIGELVDQWFGIKTANLLKLTEVRLATVKATNFQHIIGSYVQGSNDGINWTTLVEYTEDDKAAYEASGAEYYAKAVTTEETYTFFRYLNYNEQGANRLGELHLYGEEIPALPNTIDTYNGTINYSGAYAVSVDGSAAGEIISGGATTAEVTAAFDGDMATQASFDGNYGTDVDNWMGLYYEEAIVPLSFRFAAVNAAQQSRISGSYVQVSNDGINWITLFNFRNADEDPASWKYWATPAEGGTWAEGTYKVCDIPEINASYHYFRYFNYNDYGANRLSEFQVFGYKTKSPETDIPTVDIDDCVAIIEWDCGCNIAFNGVRDLAMNIAKDIVGKTTYLEDSDEPDAPTPTPTPYPVDELLINGIDISEYVISTNAAAGGTMTKAAEELQSYLEQTTGVVLPIINTVVSGQPRILIDETDYAIDDSQWEIYTDDDGIVLGGCAARGSLYVVYHFLEEFLGWRFFASDTEVCYEADSIALADIDYEYEHNYKIRDIYEVDYFMGDIGVKRYINSDNKRGTMEEWGGNISYCPTGIHNFWFFAGDDYEGDQPCLNDARVRNNFITNVRKWLDENWGKREIKSIQLSQNDNWRYCKCSDCMADIEYYGSPAGTIVEMMNLVAEDLETYNGGKYSDIYVITFAYQYSFDCPDNIVCHDQVMVEYTIIDKCFQHAINDPECEGILEVSPNWSINVRSNVEVCEEFEKWAAISKHCYLYDYSANFRYYYNVFPNINEIYEDYQLLNKIGAWGYINLGVANYDRTGAQTYSSEWGTLRDYLLCKVTEDVDMTFEEYQAHIDEFLQAYYGSAWTYVREYLDFTQQLADDYGGCFGVYSTPELMYGDHPFEAKSEWLVELFNNMLACSDLTDEQELHIRRLKVSCDYLRLGSIHQAEMGSGDYMRMQNQKNAIRNFYIDITQNLNMPWICETMTVPSSGIKWDANLRTWINKTTVHYYSEK